MTELELQQVLELIDNLFPNTKGHVLGIIADELRELDIDCDKAVQAVKDARFETDYQSVPLKTLHGLLRKGTGTKRAGGIGELRPTIFQEINTKQFDIVHCQANTEEQFTKTSSRALQLIQSQRGGTWCIREDLDWHGARKEKYEQSKII